MSVTSLRDEIILPQSSERVTTYCRHAFDRYDRLDGALIGPIIRERRKRTSMPQDRLAEAIGLTRSSICSWETERVRWGAQAYVPFKYFGALAAAFGTTIHELICGTGVEAYYRAWYETNNGDDSDWDGWCFGVVHTRPSRPVQSVDVLPSPLRVRRTTPAKPHATVRATWRYGSLLERAA